jgi:hypothetical protein
MIETQQELTTDALRRDYRPGALVILVSGAVIQLTSYPYFEGDGEEQEALVMARRHVGDPTTNQPFKYFAIMKHLGQHVPLDEVKFT